ncbi:ABC transporter permease [Paucibacter sp. JuS9]|uniref:ABC transporter permease n=1 Tax=Paucibacter sp. JuS9 TaxID=3228748 RepID=UPI0037574876
MRETLNLAMIGVMPAAFLDAAASIGTWRSLDPAHLSRGAARAHKVVLVGELVDVGRFARLVPTLRAANPQLVLVGVTEHGTHALQHLLDETLSSQADIARFAERQRASIHVASPLARAGVLLRSATARVLPVMAFLGIWSLAVRLCEPAPYLLPSPEAVLQEFFIRLDNFAMHAAVTALEALAGFVVGNTLGVFCAIALARYLRLRAFTMPILISLQAIPIVAFAPLLSVWLGTGYAAKVGMATLICFFPIVVNTLQAFASVDADHIELFRVYKARFSTTLRRLLLPASAGAITAALRISAGLSVVGAIVAEMTGADRGLGYLILNGAYRLETAVLFVALLLSGALGIAFYGLPSLLRKLLPRAWHAVT